MLLLNFKEVKEKNKKQIQKNINVIYLFSMKHASVLRGKGGRAVVNVDREINLLRNRTVFGGVLVSVSACVGTRTLAAPLI